MSLNLSTADLLKLILVAIATVVGISMSVRKNPIISGLLLFGISGLLLLTSDYPIIMGGSPIVYAGLAAGLIAGLSFPCCSSKKGHSKSGTLVFFVIALHSIIDGHVIREATNLGLLVMLGLHKFMDGTDVSMISDEASKVEKYASRIFMVIVTPLGFILFPSHVINHIVHSTLMALIISFNIGSAVHLIRHHIKIHSHVHHGSISILS